jgi:ArsR family transcriptional regulator, arsenate/arsenite/antimonite-responsive transcriptional repressor
VAATRRTPPGRDLVRVLAALADENRFRIVELLSGRSCELSCGAIGSALGLSPSLISHHLAILEGAGVIDRRKNGLWTLNRLRRDELLRHLQALQQLL